MNAMIFFLAVGGAVWNTFATPACGALLAAKVKKQKKIVFSFFIFLILKKKMDLYISRA